MEKSEVIEKVLSDFNKIQVLSSFLLRLKEKDTSETILLICSPVFTLSFCFFTSSILPLKLQFINSSLEYFISLTKLFISLNLM